MTDSIGVLYVDGDPEAAESAADSLERAHDRLAVVTAHGAEASRERLAEHSIDCVVSDYPAPTADGDSLDPIQAVRRAAPDLPVILFADEGTESVAGEAVSLGLDDYVRKRPDAGDDGAPGYARLADRIVDAAEPSGAGDEPPRDPLPRALLAASSDYVHVLDADGTLAYVSPSVERVLGYEPAELVGRDPVSLVHPDDRDRLRTRFEAVAAESDAESTDRARIRHEDGTWRWLEIQSANRLDDPRIGGVVGDIRDVTDREGAGVDPDWQRRVIRNMEEGIYVVDADHRLRFVDFRADDLDRLEEGEWTGRPLSFLAEIGVLSAAEVASIEASVDELLDGRADEIRIELAPSIPSSTGTVELRMTPMGAVDGDRLVLGTTRDVTDRKRRQEELERQNERLDEFASIVSHDLRSPLNVAEGRLRLARETCDSEHLTTALDALDRMDAIIEDTLLLARQGETTGELETVRLSELATRCWAQVVTADATVEVADDAAVRCDPDQLRHVFENLFRNSVEHSSTGSRASPDDSVEHGSRSSAAEPHDAVEDGSTDRQESGGGADGAVTVTVGTLADGEGFYVADDGPGIPADERERVFERGYSTADSGTGFGLAIVREVAEAHGWDVRATESADGGARVEITGVRFAE